MRLEIKPTLYSKTFRWIELNFWKPNKSFGGEILKLHIKIPLHLHTWKICLRGFPGSMFVLFK